ncbi:hypothetical protein [Sulfitobacter sp. R18_1]|uniref:hypothetical protein n=1 Tax=Sulfitobacter sp. R18_1 TaxID=2821104 RepID=UPI001ADCF34C|nr:hypothetical protein [Sulfitobacter sp. R18_1]MBO9427918.1 hypothetical protein [Sulfitobacter sp. R18_1]
MTIKAINRSLKNSAFNEMDHALGRPVNPLTSSYRNFFCVGFDSPRGKEMDASPYWDRVSSSDGSVTGFTVNEDGRQALSDHLIEIGDKHKVYDIHLNARKLGLDPDPDNRPIQVIAETKSKAKAAVWREISDVFEDITFKDLMQAITSVDVAIENGMEPEAPAPAPAP